MDRFGRSFKDIHRVLTKGDAIYLLELIHESLFCDNDEGLVRLINRFNYLMPFEFVLCGFSDKIVNHRPCSYNIINISYPSEWLELYVKQRFDKIDPIVKENCMNFRLQYWADTYRRYNVPKIFVSLAEDFGLRSGYTDGIRGFKSNKGSLFSFAGRSIKRDHRTEILLQYFVPHLHQALHRIFCKNKSQLCSNILSYREKEVLKWIKEGKSTWEISKILSISQNTVKFHIKQIKLKLNAVKNTQAVAIAIENGLIDLD